MSLNTAYGGADLEIHVQHPYTAWGRRLPSGGWILQVDDAWSAGEDLCYSTADYAGSDVEGAEQVLIALCARYGIKPIAPHEAPWMTAHERLAQAARRRAYAEARRACRWAKPGAAPRPLSSDPMPF